jgi:putative transferase (TIGR04331 family)
VEGYEEIARAASRDYPSRASAIVSSSAWYYDEAFKQWAATSAESGTVLIGLQHGGNYGSLRQHIDPCHEIAISDRYYTWGWDDPSLQGKVIPGPTPILAGRKTIGADNSRAGILFATTIWPRYLMQFPFHPMHFSKYLDWQFYFIEALDPSLIPVLRVRLHRWQLGWDRTLAWSDQYPEVAVEDQSTMFLTSLTKCRLYVADHLSTTFLEALSANKPTLLFWHPELVDLKLEARPYYSRLRASGILHDSPDSAAHAVTAAYADVESWWNRPERQSAVQAFCHRFARTSVDAVDEWKSRLDRFSERAQGNRA